jgi:hypothetical protein
MSTSSPSDKPDTQANASLTRLNQRELLGRFKSASRCENPDESLSFTDTSEVVSRSSKEVDWGYLLLYEKPSTNTQKQNTVFTIYLRFENEPRDEEYAEFCHRLDNLHFPCLYSKSFCTVIVPVWLLLVYSEEHSVMLTRAFSDIFGSNARFLVIPRNNTQTSIQAFFQGTCPRVNDVFPATYGQWLPRFYEWALQLYDNFCKTRGAERESLRVTLADVLTLIGELAPDLNSGYDSFASMWKEICISAIANLGLYRRDQRLFEPRHRNVMMNLEYYDKTPPLFFSEQEREMNAKLVMSLTKLSDVVKFAVDEHESRRQHNRLSLLEDLTRDIRSYAPAPEPSPAPRKAFSSSAVRFGPTQSSASIVKESALAAASLPKEQRPGGVWLAHKGNS